MFEQPIPVHSEYPQYTPQKFRHSKLGIASFIVSIFCGIGMFILIVIAGIMESIQPGGVDEESVAALVLGLFVIGSFFIQMFAFALGVAGLFQRNKYKVFAILGIVFSSLSMFGMIGLIIIGVLIGG